ASRAGSSRCSWTRPTNMSAAASPCSLSTARKWRRPSRNTCWRSATPSGWPRAPCPALPPTHNRWRRPLARLQQWNVPQAEIERVASSGKALPAFTVVSPAAGYVTVRNVLPNQQVEPQAELYRVNPLSPVWVFAQVNQNNLGRVRTGAPVTVTVDSYPGRVFAGRVEFIYPQIDAATRTARVRLVFDNPGRALM